MNREEAKEILQLCRHDHIEDLNDPLITEALEQLEKDSELCVWFEEQQALDMVIHTELKRITPPPNLKSSILESMRQQAAQDEEKLEGIQEETNRPIELSESSFTTTKNAAPIAWFRPWMGIAAIFLFASVFWVLPRKAPTPQITGNSHSTAKSAANPIINTATGEAEWSLNDQRSNRPQHPSRCVLEIRPKIPWLD